MKFFRNVNYKKLFHLSSILAASFALNKFNLNFMSNKMFCEEHPLHNVSLKTKVNIDYSHLPTYTRKEVSEHYNLDTGIWVSYKDGVYDITEFLRIHPGGEDKIKLAAGGSIEGFWAMYTFHLDSDLVLELLEKFRIGNLHPKDILKPSDIPDFSKLRKEKIEERSKLLDKKLTFPYCAEGPEEQISDHFYTPKDLFFVRNHNPIPNKIPINEYEIEIEVPNDNKINHILVNNEEDDDDDIDDLIPKARTVNLGEMLKTLPIYRETVFVSCAGNKRYFMKYKDFETKGVKWRTAAIANGIWEGIYVKDFLDYINFDYKSLKVQSEIDSLNLISTGKDKDLQGHHYNTSVPLRDAINHGLLAYKYNGEVIPFDHGYPLRLIMPGFVGVRNVKWVDKLTISKEESNSAYQKKDYKMIPIDKPLEEIDTNKILPVMKFQINSAITYPVHGQTINQDNDELKFKGWAYGESGSEINSIELSFDEGVTWEKVDKSNIRFDYNNKGKVYSWTQWSYSISLKDKLSFIKQKIDEKQVKSVNYHPSLKSDKIEVWVRATDLLGNTQPIDCKDIINLRGIMNNSVHKIEFDLV